MIFYGTKPTHLNTEKVSNYKCEHCKELNTTSISVYSKYFHLYWIPLFPYSKMTIATCDNCETETKKKNFTEQLKLSYSNIKSNSKTPIWHFTGLIIIGLLFIFMQYSSKQTAKNKIIYINNPEVNDVYYTKIDENVYSTLKVDKVTTDSVYLLQNSLTLDVGYKNYKIDKPENYKTMDTLTISKEKLLDLFNDKTIYSVKRD